MTVVMATKRGTNGLRKWLIFDTERKEFATDCRRFCPGRDDFIEIKDTDRRKQRDRLIMDGYIRVDYCKEA